MQVSVQIEFQKMIDNVPITSISNQAQLKARKSICFAKNANELLDEISVCVSLCRSNYKKLFCKNTLVFWIGTKQIIGPDGRAVGYGANGTSW